MLREGIANSEHDDRDGERAGDGQLIGEAHLSGEYGRVFGKVLVANRGEIALRDLPHPARAGCRERSPSTPTPTATRPTSAYADEAYALGGLTAAESYLVVDKLLEAAAGAGAEAVHPGYGFLAENAAFARAVEGAGLDWIGPPPAAIELMGSKTRARQTMQAAGVPIIPGTTDPVGSAEEVVALGDGDRLPAR